MRNSEWCLNHHPDKADARKRRASKGGKRGGRGRPSVEIADIKQRLSKLADDVLDGTVDKEVDRVVAQIFNVHLSAVRAELKAKEQEELVQRMEELEAVIESQKGHHYRGA
jgi:hypothetical protein